ncbi:hypothetical protein BHE74_00030324 [Ensete ventricosum]|nr:hypothetical protein GW17_00014423 [Ensete ventricosum]RWW62539.1 hypothetical protein BHE74_00030324 [Ensete ventricosum]RZS02008.1 hypothetical protein BHM03_00031971 [Ensete ventricosum]
MYRYIPSVCQGVLTVHPKTLKIPPSTMPMHIGRYVLVKVPYRSISMYPPIIVMVRTKVYQSRIAILVCIDVASLPQYESPVGEEIACRRWIAQAILRRWETDSTGEPTKSSMRGN